jgi:hypothetical protein
MHTGLNYTLHQRVVLDDRSGTFDTRIPEESLERYSHET